MMVIVPIVIKMIMDNKSKESGEKLFQKLFNDIGCTKNMENLKDLRGTRSYFIWLDILKEILLLQLSLNDVLVSIYISTYTPL